MRIPIGVLISILFTLRANPALAECAFSETETTKLPASFYAKTFLECENTQTGRTELAIRNFKIGADDGFLLVDPNTLKTSLERAKCWRCLPTNLQAQQSTRQVSALTRLTKPFVGGAYQGVGLKHSENGFAGSFITADLCPSHRPLDRGFLERLAQKALRLPIPLALSVSGLWLAHHQADFKWLLEQSKKRIFEITWVNHSDTHPYRKGVADKANFLRLPGVHIDREVLMTERRLIASGGTPSVFFRFPGLISDAALMREMIAYSLIPLDTDAWIGKGENPKRGSVLLLHANGNEPVGLKRFDQLFAASRIPEPFEAIDRAPRL